MAKTITLSDVHISNGDPQYSWFLPPLDAKLVQLLSQIASDPSVTELVLLGDFVDLWLYPINVVPYTVAQIASANPGVTQALQSCVAKIPNVYFINGNHDLEVTQDDLQPFSAGGRQIQRVTADWYNSQHPGWHLEHGNAVDMFNAYDPSPDTLAGFPLGYFITRLVASAGENQTAIWNALWALIHAFGTAHKASAPMLAGQGAEGQINLVAAIIGLLQTLAGVSDDCKIRFSDPSIDNKHTVSEIRDCYQSLFNTWQQKWPNNFASCMAAGFLNQGLDWYAKILNDQSDAPSVVVMGHTHFPETQGEYVAAYANDGYWCHPLGASSSETSYAEIYGNSVTVIKCP
jgi:UDP-2,3-diacylglucosamine pyrophosphatase LpxH